MGSDAKDRTRVWSEFLRRLEIELHAIVDFMDRKTMDLFSSSHKTKVKGVSANIKKG